MHELVIDSFAGGGGVSTGIEMALGRSPDIALNHSEPALWMHEVNHPTTHHVLANIWQADPVATTGGQPVGLLHASPDCTHHSPAKGGAPLENGRRGLAWAIARWAQEVRPRIITIENIPAFAAWGPLVNGRPCRDRQGETFRAFVRALRRFRYRRVEWRALNARDFGAPTARIRLFLVARLDDLPVCWPEPTHGPGLLPYRTAREHIDLTSIGRLVGDHLSARTRARIEAGLRRTRESAWLLKYYGSGGWQSLDEPLHTITCLDRFGLVSVRASAPHLRMLTPRELLACQGFPPGYIVERGADGAPISRRDQIALIGNSVCPPVALAIVAANYSPTETRPVRRRPAAPLPLFGEVAA